MRNSLLRQGASVLQVFLILLCLFNTAETFAQVIIPPNNNILAPSTTTLSSTANPSVAGQPVIITATVTSPASGDPTGTVNFHDNTNNIDLTPGGVAMSNGIATYQTAALTAGVMSITATYSGDAANLPSTSSAFTQTVNNPIIIINPAFYTTTTTLVSNLNPSVAGSQAVTLTATVSSSGGVNLTGKVNFFDNTNNKNLTPGGVALSNGVATFTTSSLDFGDLNITATYSGDANGNQQSTSNSLIQHVLLNISGLDLVVHSTSPGNASKWGDLVTFNAILTTGVGTPDGTVIFADNGFFLASVKLNGSGIASLQTSILTPGNHSITASWLSITSVPLTQHVDPPYPPSILVGVGTGANAPKESIIDNLGHNVISDGEVKYFYGPNAKYGQPVTFVAHVSGATGYTPTGTVTFLVGGIPLGEVGLDAGGNATFTTSILSVGENIVSMAYNGDENYGDQPFIDGLTGGPAPFVKVIVEPSPTKTAVSSSLNPAVSGQQEVTFTATVAALAPSVGGIGPTGSVTFTIDGVAQTPSPLTGNGFKAFLDISSLSPGTHTVKATYSGDGNYGGSSATITQSVTAVGSAILSFLGTSQSTPVNTFFPNHLMFDIIDINPQLTGGAAVTFTAPSSGPSGTFSNGSNTITIHTTPLGVGSVGVADSGPFKANGIQGSYTVTAYIPGLGTNEFTLTNTASLVPVSVGTSVPGLSFTIDGTTFTSTQTINWAQGTNHSIATVSPQNGAGGNQYEFTGWSDGTNTLSRNITVPSTATSYTAEFQCQQWVLDKDLDTYYAGDPVIACQSPGNGYLPKGDLKPGDCDDNDAAINPKTLWYLDIDGDGYGNKLYIPSPEGSCLPPQDGRGYIYNSKGSDCDDNDASYTPETVWVIDNDGDGYYTGNPITGCLFIFPQGAVRKTTQLPGDCDDTDPAIHGGGLTWYKDFDNDGYSDGTTTTQCTQPLGYKLATALTATSGDCNDNDAAINTGTTWLFDGDNDEYYSGSFIGLASCTSPGPGWKPFSEFTKGMDCDDNDASITVGRVWYKDADNDGYSDGTTKTQCDQPAGYKLANALTSTSGDCNDNDNTIYPAAPELCDSKDNNCNGQTDEAGATTWYRDADTDGFGDPALLTTACTQPTGYVANNTDCKDNDKTIYPGAPELCDSKDNNCNGQTDEAGATTWYRDADTDGFGDPALSTTACTQPTGYVANNTDCKDSDNTVYPGAPELCDSKDNDCDGQTDEGGSSTYYRDADGDGYGNPNRSTQSCSVPAGYVANKTDCDDTRSSVYPGAPELCDGRDNNCNGQVDEGKATFYRDADGDGYGNASRTTVACSAPSGYVANKTDCDDTRSSVYPGAPEVRDGRDNNCNGQIDEGCNTTFYRDADGDGFGNASRFVQACSAPTGYVSNKTDCDDTRSSVYPGAPELCDGRDNNCNGQIDEGDLTFYRDADGDRFGNPNRSVKACSAPEGYVSDKTDCDDSRSSVYPGAPELCDGRDNNCNGQVDEVSCNTCGNATSFSTTNITSNSARLNWVASSNPQQWQLRYRSASGWIWIDVLLTGSNRYYDVKGLSPDKDYRWQLRAKCGNNWTEWSTTQTFTTSRRSNTQTRPMPEMAETKEIQFGVMPNPSNTNFRITLSSNDSKKPVKLVVTDMSGRVIETRTAVAGQTITIGDSYKGGTYIVNIIQGNDRRQMKLVKVN